ncbi:MAG: ATP-binding protein [Bryobacteraceae bacterium]
MISLVLAAGLHLRHVNVTTMALVLVLAVLGIALVWGWVEALVAALAAGLGLNYFFLPPRGFGIEDLQHWVALLAFLATAVATGQLSARERQHRAEAVKRRTNLEKIHKVFELLRECDSADAIVRRLAGSLLEIAGVETVAVYHGAIDRTWRSGAGGERIADGQLRAVAASGNCFENSDTSVAIVPLRESGELAGSIGAAGAGVTLAWLEAVAETVENAMARAQVAEKAKEAEIARRADELRSAMFDALAHEATGPLATIEIAASTLLSDRPGDAAQQREMLTIIREEVDRFSRWIGDTVRMSHAGAGELALNKAPQDVRDLVTGALETVGRRTDGRPIRVEVAGALPMAFCDAAIIQQVLHLLLDNAIKYSPPGSPISIASSRDDATGMVVVSVADSGPGVPADEQARIFEKHYRGSLHSSSVPGMGLGLASARYLVESHGGAIWVTNRAEGGAAFHFSLPSSDGVTA